MLDDHLALSFSSRIEINLNAALAVGPCESTCWQWPCGSRCASQVTIFSGFFRLPRPCTSQRLELSSSSNAYLKPCGPFIFLSQSSCLLVGNSHHLFPPTAEPPIFSF